MVRITRFHRVDRGSIPRKRIFRFYSSVGQSACLMNRRSWVQVPLEALEILFPQSLLGVTVAPLTVNQMELVRFQ